ncbi:8977_t:CDS:10 [Entrophospora sp. SA101]|nr:8977_t:CDS:10 [Entrophospora sp. SA101]
MHALTTFSQLIYNVKDDDENNSIAYIPFAPHEIKDYPKYKHRGLLLDTSRNYYPVKDILKIIETMSWNKFNVFHWHIVDATSWPYVSKEFPELSEKGAYDSKTMIYTNQDIKNIINFGQKRGVRIIPEFDMPGHTFSVSYSKPELIVCPNKQPNWDLYSASPPSGQLNPVIPETYQFVEKLVTEITSLFTDKFYHSGGDEININCWMSDESISDYIANNPGTTGDTLIEKFYNELHNVVRKQGKTPMIWEEAIVNHKLKLPSDVVVQVWTNAKHVKKVVNQGYRVVTGSSDYWYLDCGHGAWGLTPEESKFVIGGEVLLWSEQSDSMNYENYLWPRSSSAAEVLWSGNFDMNGQARDLKDALPRLNDWRFRMVLRGTRADPLQPLWCVRTNQFSSLANVLVEEVAAEEAAHYEEDVIDGNTLLLITTNNEILKTCEVIEGNDVGKDDRPVKNVKEISTPSFKKWIGDGNDDDGINEYDYKYINFTTLKTKKEDISDKAYERRHKKFELSEKKLKNREKERLQYERYQQQLAVEKLRNTDSKTLMSVASLRSNEPANNDMIRLETVREKLLKEAEDQLARYDSLGLGGLGKGKNGVVNDIKIDDETEEIKIKRPRIKKNNTISGSFINPNVLVSTASRKSARTRTTMVVFGIKIQTKRSKKQPPKELFGPPSPIYDEMLMERDEWRLNEHKEQVEANKELNNFTIANPI